MKKEQNTCFTCYWCRLAKDFIKGYDYAPPVYYCVLKDVISECNPSHKAYRWYEDINTIG